MIELTIIAACIIGIVYLGVEFKKAIKEFKDSVNKLTEKESN